MQMPIALHNIFWNINGELWPCNTLSAIYVVMAISKLKDLCNIQSAQKWAKVLVLGLYLNYFHSFYNKRKDKLKMISLHFSLLPPCRRARHNSLEINLQLIACIFQYIQFFNVLYWLHPFIISNVVSGGIHAWFIFSLHDKWHVVSLFAW